MIISTIHEHNNIALIATIDEVTSLVINYLVVDSEGATEYFSYKKAESAYNTLVEEYYD